MNLRHTLTGIAALAACSSAFADIKINDNLSTSGYVVGSYQITDPTPGTSVDKFDLDAAKMLFTYSLKQTTGVISVYHAPGAPENLAVLDAYASYDAGNGITITGGKFLSNLGYEAFDAVNMTQISYANGKFLAPIPGYHTGVKLDFSDKEQAFGVALLDSVYSGSYYLKGDGELKHNAGFEGYYVYKAVKDLTLWSGFAYETKGNVVHKDNSILTLDFWASYQATKDVSLGAEYAHKDGGTGDKGYNWLAYLGYSFTDKISTAFRVSGEDMTSGPSFTKYTVSPAYKVTESLTVRAEVSQVEYKNYAAADRETFFGVQALFKF